MAEVSTTEKLIGAPDALTYNKIIEGLNIPQDVFFALRSFGYGYTQAYWRNCKVRYRAFKGGRNTKKSTNMLGFEILDKILSTTTRNIVAFRAYDKDLKDSVYNQLLLACALTGTYDLFIWYASPLKVIRRDTRQTILFRGCERPQAIKSSLPERGIWTDFYFEEAYELDDYYAFHEIDGSLRGVYHDETGVPLQITLIFNPTKRYGCRIYDKFFKGRLEDDQSQIEELETKGYVDYLNETEVLEYGVGLYLQTSSYKINEFRDKNVYDRVATHMKEVSPRMYLTDFLGFWGTSGNIVYEAMSDNLIISRFLATHARYKAITIGIDTAYSNAEGKPNTKEPDKIKSAYVVVLKGLTDDEQPQLAKDVPPNSLVIIDEFYYSNDVATKKMSQLDLYRETITKIFERRRQYENIIGERKINVFIDSADSGALTSLQEIASRSGLYGVRFIKSTKFKIDMRVQFTDLLMAYGEYLMSEACANSIREFRQCQTDPKTGVRSGLNDHCINANEYADAPLYAYIKRINEYNKFADLKSAELVYN
jgi:phage terminase large subunit